ncbi:unnamed protein product [Rotaria sp. Silwood2]|nr:unnamed protein product [Rotaria sp. Silwood2]CAF4288194.1 unnamed protein product [Rotaria sp. Silwood2]
MFNYSNNSLIDYNESIPSAVKFWLYLILLIPSIICSVFVLCHLLWKRSLRHALHNRAIVIFLFICLIHEITIYPWMLHFYNMEGIWKRTTLFCTVWLFIDCGLYYTQTILFAWATIERHILIFHDKWISTKKKRLLVHYLPLLILVLYCLIYYIVVTFFPPCENIFDAYSMICIELCLYASSSSLYTYDTIVHQVLPILTIVGFSIGLLIRIRLQKHHIGQSLKWRKHWKMTVQLLLVSVIYLIFGLPLTVTSVLHLCGVPLDVTAKFREYARFLNDCTMILCPIVSAISLPKLRNERQNTLRVRHRVRAIAPVT